LASPPAVGRRGIGVSVLTKNAAALAARPALEGRYRDALDALAADRDLGRLGAVTRGDTVKGLSEMLDGVGISVERWYGVRVFTDHLGDRPPTRPCRTCCDWSGRWAVWSPTGRWPACFTW
jgi:hypothetical protein